MGIIKRHISAKSGGSAVTIIAEGNRFYGDTVISGKMHIDGTFEGSLHSTDDISIGRNGLVAGQIFAKTIYVNGRLEGEIICDNLHIEKGGTVNGRLCCAKLQIDNDGSFIGERTLPDALLAADVSERSKPKEQHSTYTSSELMIDNAMQLIDSLPDRITLTKQE
ncbi:bactofilin family protein [Nitrincola tibetensis]|uniref:bactofilin family protein n=1 Tax=Nitrincola tibetensis TaxID=2219697 RepID=UPI001EFC52B4|nr:polymer-forming cytoskeletal protein [Nitrincola tibetensis]